MRIGRSLVLVVLVFGWSTAGVQAGDAPAPKSKTKVKCADRAPDFSLRDRDGNLLRLSDFCFPGPESARKKKVRVLLDFFATDCKACKAELPQVIEYSKKHSEDTKVLLIAIPEQEDGQAKLEAFLKDHPVPFPVLVDAYEKAAKLYVADGNSLTLPALFLIDKDGSVEAVLQGLEKDLEVALQAARQSRPIPANKTAPAP
jgi:peroxiredoxin